MTSRRVVRWLVALVALTIVAALVPVVIGLYVGWRTVNVLPTALSGYLIRIGDEGWVWYFSTLAGESRPGRGVEWRPDEL